MMNNWYSWITRTTENYLTHRKRKKALLREKQKNKNQILDWLEAFLWAAAVVLIINQYLFQAYQIPTGSMIDTLLIQDRVFVNKAVYGPEILPGLGKLPGLEDPVRDEVIIFESPTYIGRGTAFTVLQRILYMLTLSMVDIDRDEDGNPRAQLLIKRAVGVGGDQIRFVDGEVELKPPGIDRWISEEDFRKMTGIVDRTRRLIDETYYPEIRTSGLSDAYISAGIQPPAAQIGRNTSSTAGSMDILAWMAYRSEGSYAAAPHDRRTAGMWRRFEMGWYIPDGWFFPLGDNRDNSKDARHFGPVSEVKVLGRAMFKYWPMRRIGRIR